MAKSKKSSAPKVDPFLEGLMGKLMDRLSALERKMDTVIAHATRSSAPVQQHRPAPQPQQVFSHPHALVEAKHLPRHEQRRPMYEAVCADCKEACEVPFRPTPERAVYCKPCFAKRKSEGRVHPPAQNPQAQNQQPKLVSAPAQSKSAAPAPAAAAKKSKPAAKPAKAAKAKPAKKKK